MFVATKSFNPFKYSNFLSLKDILQKYHWNLLCYSKKKLVLQHCTAFPTLHIRQNLKDKDYKVILLE